MPPLSPTHDAGWSKFMQKFVWSRSQCDCSAEQSRSQYDYECDRRAEPESVRLRLRLRLRQQRLQRRAGVSTTTTIPDPADTDNDGDDADNDAVSDGDEGSTPTRSQQNPTTPVDATVGGPRRWSQAEKSRSRAQGTVPGPPDGLYPGAGALIAWQLRGGSVPRFGELKGEMFRARHISLRTLPEARLGVDGAAETIGAFDGAGGCRTECCTRRSAWHSPTRLAASTCSSLIHWSSQGECTGCRRSSRLLDTLFVLEGDGTCCLLATTATTTQYRSQSATQYRSQPADKEVQRQTISEPKIGPLRGPQSGSDRKPAQKACEGASKAPVCSATPAHHIKLVSTQSLAQGRSSIFVTRSGSGAFPNVYQPSLTTFRLLLECISGSSR